MFNWPQQNSEFPFCTRVKLYLNKNKVFFFISFTILGLIGKSVVILQL